MWLLQNTKDPGSRFYLLVGETYTVGRKDCKILILNDNSVSRRHATLAATHSEANLKNPDARPALTLTDSSKFGSVQNGSKIATGASVALEDGDRVIFGALNTNLWSVSYTPLVLAYSSLSSANKKALRALTLRLGGHVVPEWSKECTHLVMNQLTVTIKVIGALVTCRPIVTPAFLQRMEEAALGDLPMPDPTEYQPDVAEEAISGDNVSFRPKPGRRTLFAGKTFVFLAQKQFKQLGATVRLAGAGCRLLDEGLTDGDLAALLEANTLVMYADPSDQSQVMTQAGQEWVKAVMDTLKRHSLRPIPQSELGLAVLYASTDIHCNPKVAQAGLTLLHPVAAPSLPTEDVLASETQPSAPPGPRPVRGLVPSSAGPGKADKESASLPVAAEEDIPTKKRLREEGETLASASPSKLPKAERGRGLGRPPQTPPGAEDEDGLAARPSLEPTPVAGTSAPCPCPADLAERRRERRAATAKDDGLFAQPQASAAVDAGPTDSRAPPSTRAGAAKRGAAPTGEESSDEEVLSPTEREPEEQSSTSARSNANPHEPKPSPRSGRGREVLPSTDKPKSFDCDNGVPPPGNQRRRRGGLAGRRRCVEDEDPFAVEMEEVEEEEEEEEVEVVGEGNAAEPEMWRKTSGRSKPSGNQRTGGRAGRRCVEDEDPFAMETEEREKEEEEAGEENAAETEMWNKTPKRSRPTTESEMVDDDTGTDGRIPLSDVPVGYLVANKALKREPGSPGDPTLPSNLAVVERVVVVIRRPLLNGSRPAIAGGAGKKGPRNFKHFKKASYAGQHSLPRIIGGSDLEHRQSGHGREAEIMMDRERETLRKKEKEKDEADGLFDWEQKPTKRRR